MLSIIVPVYRSEANLIELLAELQRVSVRCPVPVEVIFVVDGSPDRSAEILGDRLPLAGFRSQLVRLSRNFGAFNAVRCGMERATGRYVTALPADLQEPADLAVTLLDILRQGTADVVFATSSTRSDPWLSRLLSRTFWRLYRRLVLPDLPPGGVHAFACTREVRDRFLQLREPTFNFFVSLFWLGYRRAFVDYDRLARRAGRSGWTLGRKVRYALDSVFSATDLPIRILVVLGALGTVTALVLGALVLVGGVTGRITVPGYAAMAVLVTFFGSITSLGMGILGEYLWLVLQTARGRPGYLVERIEHFDAAPAAVAAADGTGSDGEGTA